MNEDAPSPPPSPAPPANRKRMMALFIGMEFLGLLLFLGTLYVWLAPDWKAKKADAAAAAALAAAVERHAAENGGRLPAAAVLTQHKSLNIDTDTSPASGLVAALMGRGPEGGADFLQGFPAAVAAPDTPHGWKGGLVSGPEGCAVYDSRGRFLQARLDIGGYGRLDNPNGKQEKRELPGRAIVWSSGKDGDPYTWRDNAMSWE